MKNCLFSTGETDLLTALRNGEEIAPLIHQNIVTKKEALGGQFTTEIEKIETNNLSSLRPKSWHWIKSNIKYIY